MSLATNKLTIVIRRVAATPGLFFLRQLYRFFLIFPYEALVVLIAGIRGLIRHSEPAPSVDCCFIITSVIYAIEKKKVSYNGIRSLYTPEERGAQTVQTIASIRRYQPNAKIILVEGGRQSRLPAQLAALVDQYIYVGQQAAVRIACDSSNKSLGEAAMLLAGARQFAWPAEYYFKISGRYCLDERFNRQAWNHQAMMFRYYYPYKNYFSTRLYGFHRRFFGCWQLALWKGLPYNIIDYPIEHTLFKFIRRKNIHPLTTLGIIGMSATVANDCLRE